MTSTMDAHLLDVARDARGFMPDDNADNPSGGTQFDPDQYESPPQGQPDTGDGNGQR